MNKRRSGREIVVEGETRTDALEAGCELLGLSPSEVEVQVISRGRRGILGFFQKPWRLKIRPRPDRGSLLDATLEEAMKAVEGVDGSFNLHVEERHIMLTVYPPAGTGEPVEPVEVIRHLEQIGLEHCDYDKVRSAVEKQSEKPVRIGAVPAEENFDAHYEVEVSDDQLSAVLTMFPPRLGGKEPVLEDIKRELAKNNVSEGINVEIIENMIEAKRYNEPVVVARGRKPEPGDDGKIKYYFKTGTKPDFADSEGRVDFRELGLVKNVHSDDLLAEIIPPLPGRPGMTVTGEKIEAPKGEEKDLNAGTGVYREENKFFAEEDGQVVTKKNSIEVQGVYEVDGDVDYSTGNIDFSGTVIITGNVRDRFRVRASGDIIIEKGVGKAYLQAGNNIIVKEGIRGKGGAQVNAAGNVVAEFIEHAGVIVQKSVMVAEMILHSRVDAGEGVYVSGSRGLITGGQIRAGQQVLAEEIGSIGTSETRVEVGIDPLYFREMAKIEEKIINQKEKLDKIERAIKSLSGRPELSKEEEGKLEKLEENSKSLSRNIENFKEEQEALVRRSAVEEGAAVSVAGTVHTGTRISIGNDVYLVRASNKDHCTFRILGDRIEVASFKRLSPPSI